jgi:CheY-like chemotaxis protein
MPEVAPPRLDGIHILVVEDDDDARYVLQSYLTYHGADVATARSGTEALALVVRVPVHVVVSDLSMPGMSGIEFMVQFRKLPGQTENPTPAIACTAFADVLHRDAALASGFQVFVRKPFDPLTVVHEVARLYNESKGAA